MAAAFEPFFTTLPGRDARRRFCIWHWPSRDPDPAWRGIVVHVHAFAEEMNKSRRMAAMQARALAAEGFAVLQMDLLGCGDSEGEFGDATWAAWLADVHGACLLAEERWKSVSPALAPPQRWIWGHRAGALLAAQTIGGLPTPDWQLLFWQPTLNGKTALQQFLRLEAAAALLGKPPADGRPSARARLAAGETVEIAGYSLQPALAMGLESARLLPPGMSTKVVWLDVATSEAEGPPPAVQAALDTWRGVGCEVTHQQIKGPSFWQTTEIEDAPSLIEATTRGLL